MRTLLVAGVLPLLACSTETLEKLQSPAASMTELSHVVTLRLNRGAAVLTVSRQFRNDAQGIEELEHPVGIPAGAVATSLRVGADGRWQDEVLLGAEEAANRWAELTGPGDGEASPVALLEAASGRLQLRFFGLAPKGLVTVEYELQVPLVYEAGGRWFEYPAEEAEDLLVAVPTFELSRVAGARVEEADGASKVWLPPVPIDRTDAKWALYPIGPERTMWRLELDAAAVLEPAPRRPSVVFVVDASHSQGAEGIAAQLELLPAYLANAPDAQVEVIVYRRFAERLFGRFVPAADVQQLLSASTPKLTPGNGSNLELGVRLAAEVLGQTSGAGRMVVFTDEQLREGFSNEAAIGELAKASPQTVTHVVVRHPGEGGALSEARDDEAELAPLASAGGGVVLRVGGRVDEPAQAARTLLGLVRPVRIDGFKIEAPGLEGDRLDAPEVLLEGESLRYTAIADRPPSEVTVIGKIWAREYRKVLRVDDDLAYWMPGLAIGLSEIESQLSDEEVRRAALAARAVSRMTSYLSAKPDAAASAYGSLVLGMSGYGWGTSGCGCRGGVVTGCGGFRSGGVRPDYEGMLRRLLAPGVAACGAAATGGVVRIEATGDEIVDVQVEVGTPEQGACIAEAAWAVRLPPVFVAHETYAVELSP